MSFAKETMMSGLGDMRDSVSRRDFAHAMGNACEGRLAQQKFAAVILAHGIQDRARARGMEYTGL